MLVLKAHAPFGQYPILPAAWCMTSCRSTSANVSGIWTARTFDRFSITEGHAVPLPGTLVLIGLALLGTAGRRRTT